jgi:hypothetical protein
METIYLTLFEQSAIESSLKLGLQNPSDKVEMTLDCSFGNQAESDPAADSGFSKPPSDNPANVLNTTLSLNGISPSTAQVIPSANTTASPDTRFSFPSRAPGQFRCLESRVSPLKLLTFSCPLFFPAVLEVKRAIPEPNRLYSSLPKSNASQSSRTLWKELKQLPLCMDDFQSHSSQTLHHLAEVDAEMMHVL